MTSTAAMERGWRQLLTSGRGVQRPPPEKHAATGDGAGAQTLYIFRLQPFRRASRPSGRPQPRSPVLSRLAPSSQGRRPYNVRRRDAGSYDLGGRRGLGLAAGGRQGGSGCVGGGAKVSGGRGGLKTCPTPVQSRGRSAGLPLTAAAAAAGGSRSSLAARHVLLGERHLCLRLNGELCYCAP